MDMNLSTKVCFYSKALYYALAFMLLFVIAGCDSTKTVINPEIVLIDASSVTIAWLSDKPYKGQVFYHAAGKGDMIQKAMEDFSHSCRHEIHIDGLKTGTQYIYWIGSKETKYFFRTEPADVKPFSFLIGLDDLSGCINNLLMSEMPEFVLLYSSGSGTKKDCCRSIRPYVPVYDLDGRLSGYLKGEKKDQDESWRLDWGGMCLIFVDKAAGLDRYMEKPTAHTTGIIVREAPKAYTEQAIRDSALHARITEHNKKWPANNVAFVFIPGPDMIKRQIDAINYIQMPIKGQGKAGKTAAIRIDVNVESTYAVMLDTDEEITLKMPPLKEKRTCVECRRLAGTGAYKKSVQAYREFIKNNQGHFQIDDAYYSIADILDTKLFMFKEAVEWYNKLIKSYPNSSLTPLARQRLQYISKYADHDYEPLSRFEQIRRVEYLQIKDNSADKQRVLDKAQEITAQYGDAAITPVIYYWLANQYRSHDVQKAKEAYLKLSARYPDHPYSLGVWWEIGEAYYDARDYKEAIGAFNEALKAMPDSAEDIRVQIKRAKRNLRRSYINLVCLFIPVFMILSGVFLPPVGIELNRMYQALLSFIVLLSVFLFASWLIAEQFSSMKELFKITAGAAAAFSFGFVFSYMLSDKILKISMADPEKNKMFSAFLGLVLNLIFAASVSYLTIYNTNEHFLTIFYL